MKINIQEDIIVQENDNSIIEDIKQIKDSSRKVYLVVKRIIDIILSIIGLIVLLPIFAVIAVAIKIDSKGPVFFVHKRIGKNGKEIGIYKFRTMIPDAEKMIKHFSENQKKEFKENFKLEYDPRVTKIGRFLRKTSLLALLYTSALLHL